MIPIKILLSLLKIKISNITSFLKKYNKIIAVFIIMIFTAIFVWQRNQLQLKDKELARVNNNYEYYQNLVNKESDKNRILQLTVNEFQQNKDSLVNEIKTIQKKLKIKDKDLNQVQIITTEIKTDTAIVVKDANFDKVIRPNNLTSIQIIKQDSILTVSLDIKNSQTLFISHKKEYRHKYRNWFSRLLHFDFKKDINYKYQIHNSNDLIRIESTRIIEITK